MIIFIGLSAMEVSGRLGVMTQDYALDLEQYMEQYMNKLMTLQLFERSPRDALLYKQYKY